MDQKCRFRKNIGVKRIRFRKKFKVRKKKLGSVKIWIPKKTLFRKNLGSEQIWGRKKLRFEKIKGSKI